MLYHVGPHGEAPSFGHEAEAGVMPEPLLGFLWENLDK